MHVSITDSTTGAAIYYTTNNTMPTTSSTLYTRPFPIATTSTVQAIAALNGVSSGVDSVTYTFGAAVAAPTFSPASGTFTGSAAVTISDATGGSTIYYTTDGSTPKAGVGTTQQYTGTITLTKSTALKAIAVVGSASSTVATSAYRIKAGT